MSVEVIRKIDAIPSETQLKAFATKIDAAAPEEKFIFLATTFNILSTPDPESQDRRNIALAVLRIVHLEKFSSTVLRASYVEAVASLKKTLNKNSDPFGEIDALLEAGKIIAPFVKNIEPINQIWAQIASKFPKKDAQYIMNAVEEIKKLALTQPPKLEPQAGAPLEEPEKIRVRYGERKRTPEQEQLMQEVKALRIQGMGNQEMAEKLGKSPAIISNIASGLVQRGEIERIKPGLKKKT